MIRILKATNADEIAFIFNQDEFWQISDALASDRMKECSITFDLTGGCLCLWPCALDEITECDMSLYPLKFDLIAILKQEIDHIKSHESADPEDDTIDLDRIGLTFQKGLNLLKKAADDIRARAIK